MAKKKEQKPDRTCGDCIHEYVGEWDELMEEARPDIVEMVEELKTR